MSRYVSILLLLAALGAVYGWMGGFSPELEASLPDPAAMAHVANRELQTHLEPTGTPLERVEAVPPIGIEVATPQDPAPTGMAALVEESGPLGEDPDGWRQISIGRGQSFYEALSRAGLSHESIMALVKECKPHTDLRRVQRGDKFDVKLGDDGEVDSFLFALDGEHFLLSSRNEAGYSTEIGSYELDRVVKGVRGEIRTSLFDALVEQGADPTLAVQLSEILGWDIDFFRDLRKGDSFSLLYEEFSREGKRVRDGRILAAQFVNQGNDYDAFLFANDIGIPAYYDGKGASLEKQFLRAPMKYSRISSGFSRRRLHPIYKSYRPHFGIDYAAPRGTPIYATAAGKVTERQKKRGNGNYIVVRHGNGYETYYLHLSRFAKGLVVGKNIEQGDVIGYVGQTGAATGPHLCYRVKRDGKWLNPRKLDLPPAEPIDDAHRPAFETAKAELSQQLESIPGMDAKTVVLESQRTRPQDEPAGR